MPCPYVIVKERRLVITTAEGRLTFAEAKAHQERLKNDPDFNPEFNQLLDTTAVTTLDISTEEAKIVAHGSLFFAPSSQRAWVAPTPHIFGMARFIQAHREMAGAQDHFHVFYERDAALKWLGLSATQD